MGQQFQVLFLSYHPFPQQCRTSLTLPITASVMDFLVLKKVCLSVLNERRSFLFAAEGSCWGICEVLIYIFNIVMYDIYSRMVVSSELILLLLIKNIFNYLITFNKIGFN